jgi:hypothetical protein
LKEAATAEAAQAVSRENYMLDLMADASLDMGVCFTILNPLLSFTIFSSFCALSPE